MYKSLVKLKLIIVLTIICQCLVLAQKPLKKGGPIVPKKPTQQLSIEADADTTKAKGDKKIGEISNKKNFQRQASIKINSLHRGDSVILRWAVTSPGGWITANNSGFVIERLEVDANGNDVRRILTDNPLKPWTLQEWKSRVSKDNKYAAIAAQCLYGKTAIKELGAENGQYAYENDLKSSAIEFSNRYGFAMFAADVDMTAANGLALRFVDRKIEKNKNYIYRVSVAVQDSTYYIHHEVINVNTSRDDVFPPAPLNLKSISYDKKIQIYWDNNEVDLFTAFNLYRSEDNGKTYNKLNKNPIVPFQPTDMKDEEHKNADYLPGIFMDSNVVNYKEYTYCLKGITSFAEESECATIKAMAKDKTAPQTPVLSAKQIGTNQLRLSWTFDNKANDLSGFAIAKSNDFETNYIRIHAGLIDKNLREYIDNAANEEEAYYIISAIDTAGNITQSNPFVAMIVDSTPPSKPTGLTGTIDSLGRVDLSWDLGAENNISGYRVFWANDSTHEFIQIAKTIVEDINYTDSIDVNTLTKHVYYKVCALSNRFIPSPMSDMIEIKRPDYIAPQPAVFTGFTVTDGAIHLKWEQSRSNDVEKQIIIRRSTGSKDWVKLAELDKNDNQYFDKAIEPNTNYEYSILTLDDSQLFSQSESNISAYSAKGNQLKTISDLAAKYNEQSKSINLSWKYNQTKAEGKYWFAIYRKYETNGAKSDFQLYNNTDSTKLTFLDNTLLGKGVYSYSIRVVSESGESELSSTTQIEIK